MFRPVAVARRVDRHHGETAPGHETARTVHDARGLLVLSAAVPHHDQGTGPAGTLWSPQHARDVTEKKELFKDVAGRRLRGEAHRTFRPFRDASVCAVAGVRWPDER